MTLRAPPRSRAGPDIGRLLRRATEYDAHMRRLWREALARGYSQQWIARRILERFPKLPGQ